MSGGQRPAPKRRRSDSLTPPPSAKPEATDERHFTNAPLGAQGRQTPYTSGQQSVSQFSESGAAPTPTSNHELTELEKFTLELQQKFKRKTPATDQTGGHFSGSATGGAQWTQSYRTQGSAAPTPAPSNELTELEKYRLELQQRFTRKAPVMNKSIGLSRGLASGETHTSGQTSGSASGGSQWKPPLMPTVAPKERLQRMYDIHTYGQPLPRPADSTSSGVLNVKSSEDMDKYKTYLNKSPADQKLALNDKTAGDLKTLRENGFDIKFSDTGRLGQGFCGEVYRGVFNDGIKNLTTEAGKHMKGAAAGKPFAAKYVTFASISQPIVRLHLEMEKQIMKRIAHQNIVDLKVAINLGKKRYLVHKSDPQIKPIVSYDRMFLIMDLAEGDLNDFCFGSTLTNELAIDFTRDMCAGMCYMHAMGVVHYDAHAGNVLIFETPTGPVAKWADFGLSIWRQKYEEWGDTVTDNEYMQLIHTKDLFYLSESIELMADTVPTGPDSVDRDLHRLARDLRKPGQTLAEVLQSHERFRHLRNL